MKRQTRFKIFKITSSLHVIVACHLFSGSTNTPDLFAQHAYDQIAVMKFVLTCLDAR